MTVTLQSKLPSGHEEFHHYHYYYCRCGLAPDWSVAISTSCLHHPVFFTAACTWRDIPTTVPLYLVVRLTPPRSTTMLLCYVMLSWTCHHAELSPWLCGWRSASRTVARCDMDVLGGAASPWEARESTYVGLWTGHASRPYEEFRPVNNSMTETENKGGNRLTLVYLESGHLCIISINMLLSVMVTDVQFFFTWTWYSHLLCTYCVCCHQVLEDFTSKYPAPGWTSAKEKWVSYKHVTGGEVLQCCIEAGPLLLCYLT